MIYLYKRLMCFQPNEQVYQTLHVTIQVFRDILGKGMDIESREVLDAIHGLSETSPEIFYRSKDLLFEVLIDIVKASTQDSVEEELKVLSLETMSELVTSPKCTQYRGEAPTVLALLFGIMRLDNDEDEAFDSNRLERPDKSDEYDDSFGCDVDNQLTETATENISKICEISNQSV